ncbi:CBS domain-containing protein [Urbifossiella limnaea]|uniref:Inosine-5'-monophosphate dehydrogenase n=1 Tax=Urbifossiella limnaea TaxID=2528023 RepID=A0A517XZH2_9BACT|nr:CBS domain-containing protein [Urbifossiella limnaea]QDU22911.1 Inosine-5'-monophosphate dehydrogenase [Urbifossiella limnaea]
MYCPACNHSRNPPGADACEHCGLPLTHTDEAALHGRVERSLMTDPVSILAPATPVTVAPDATLADAIRLMIDRRVGAVLVVGAAGELVGILTERDFLTRVAGRPGFEQLPVADHMTRDPETVTPADTLAFALGRMDAGGYRHLPVVAGGKPVGMVSIRDVLRHVTRISQGG